MEASLMQILKICKIANENPPTDTYAEIEEIVNENVMSGKEQN